ncbi:MAG: T9SS type A sorting domain-containing protein, partial [Endomicrobia bacterium]|nr:T9SS type A sorting domain-containing protein [Endomicrobiia bacterium]
TKIISDGLGGAIITWQDRRNSVDSDIYAQRIDKDGNVKWTINGVAISIATNNQRSPQIISDGLGGAIITWQDARNGVDYDIYAQRIDKDGNVKWTINGVAIYTATDNQMSPQIVSDGLGSAIITWEDDRNSNWDIYAQRISNPAPEITSISPNSGVVGETLSITIDGSWFYLSPSIIFSESQILVNSINFISETQIKLDITISKDAKFGKSDITLTNLDGQSVVKTSIFEVKPETSTEETTSLTLTKITLKAETGDIEVYIPEGTFSEQVKVNVNTKEPPVSDRATIKTTNIGIEIKTDKGLQPQKGITITIYYRDSDVVGLDESQLVIGRYDENNKRWIPLLSTADPTNNKVTAITNHLSIFAILQLVAANDLSSLKAYPNPYNPLVHTGGLVIDGLTSQAKIKIYTITGELVKEVEYTTANGRAIWDGKNTEGSIVSSGVYVIYVEGSNGEKKKLKVAVEK